MGIHTICIVLASRADVDRPATSASDLPDNTRQLVRLSRLWVFDQPLVKASLSAVPSKPAKPPPPPQLTKPPQEPSPISKPTLTNNPAASAAGLSHQQSETPAQCAGQKSQGFAPLTLATVAALWSLGRVPDAPVETIPVESPIDALRELPLAAFSGRGAKELDGLQLEGDEHNYQLWVQDDQVWTFRRPSP